MNLPVTSHIWLYIVNLKSHFPQTMFNAMLQRGRTSSTEKPAEAHPSVSSFNLTASASVNPAWQFILLYINFVWTSSFQVSLSEQNSCCREAHCEAVKSCCRGPLEAMGAPVVWSSITELHGGLRPSSRTSQLKCCFSGNAVSTAKLSFILRSFQTNHSLS